MILLSFTFLINYVILLIFKEDIEPFPVENKKLLDALKEGKSLTNSPEEKGT